MSQQTPPIEGKIPKNPLEETTLDDIFDNFHDFYTVSF